MVFYWIGGSRLDLCSSKSFIMLSFSLEDQNISTYNLMGFVANKLYLLHLKGVLRLEIA